MSLARIYTTKKVQKDWTCGKCGKAIRKGVDGRISFAVGYRGYEQTRCTDAACRPTRSERESSLLSSVYAAQDDLDLAGIDNTDDFQAARDEVVAAVNEVAEEYSNNEMFDINEDLQERAQMLEDAASELENWEPENEEPTEDDFDPDEDPTKTFEDVHAEWVDETRESLESAINEMELP